jgi:hypothetical protein
VDNRTMFSIGDRGLNMFMKEFINFLYPKPSKYEKVNKNFTKLVL